jgi:putative transport protein
MNYFIHALREHQELAVFLTLALGFLIGRFKFGSFSLGTAVGTLLAGVLIGQLNVQVPAVVKYVFFDLFLFTTGYKVGPQFFRALKKDALPQMALTLVLCVTCLLGAFTAAKLLGYDIGTAAGLLAGAFTESTVIGTASDAIGRLGISAADKTSLTNNIPVAYAVTYLIGTAFIVWFLPNVGPKLMRVDLKEEARKLRAKLSGSGTGEAEAPSAYQALAVRAYRVTHPDSLVESVRPGQHRSFSVQQLESVSRFPQALSVRFPSSPRETRYGGVLLSCRGRIPYRKALWLNIRLHPLDKNFRRPTVCLFSPVRRCLDKTWRAAPA